MTISIRGPLQRKLGTLLATALPRRSRQTFLDTTAHIDPDAMMEALGPLFNRTPNLGNMPFDLPTRGEIGFEHLAGLFASTNLNHAVISMPIRQAAYVYDLIRTMPARKVIEIGRYKGGGTLLMAAAMRGEGDLWSIDIGEKGDRLFKGGGQAMYDKQLQDILNQLKLTAHIIVGDSWTLKLETGGEVDCVYIDGDHSYDGVKTDFERFGRKVRVGGAVLFDDAYSEGFKRAHVDTVGRLVEEIVAGEDYTLVKKVNRLAHLERVR